MRIATVLVIAALTLAGCTPREAPDANTAAPDPAGSTADLLKAGWDLQSTGECSALAFTAEAGIVAIRLVCAAGQNRLLVNVPAFTPIGSEERLSFGSGGDG